MSDQRRETLHRLQFHHHRHPQTSGVVRIFVVVPVDIMMRRSTVAHRVWQAEIVVIEIGHTVPPTAHRHRTWTVGAVLGAPGRLRQASGARERVVHLLLVLRRRRGRPTKQTGMQNFSF